MNIQKSLFKFNRKIFLFIIIISCSNLIAQVITKGPYLADPNSTSITIRWESDIQASYIVQYGTNKEMMLVENAEQIDSMENHFLYETKIENLVTGEKYFYQIVANESRSKINEFKSNQIKGEPITFVVTGDSRSHPKIFKTIVEKINQLNPDLILSMGDVVRNGGDYSQWGKYYFDIAQNIMNHIPIVSTLGDHEGDSTDGDNGKLFKYFLYPHSNHEKLWFSYTYGDAHFVVLDYRHPNSKEMIEWFENDMSNSNSKWKFVYMHRPSYNLGGHRSAWGREVWPKLFNKYEVDIVFSGHSHLYERFYPVRPRNSSSSHAVTYITTGGSGASLYKTGQSSVLAFAKSIHHYLTVKIDGENINLTAYKKDGSFLDNVSWEKGSDEFNILVKAQGEIDIVGMLMNTISQQLERLPMREIPASTRIKLNPLFCKEDVYYKISLTEESKKYYEMETVSCKTNFGDSTFIDLKIYAKGDMTVSKWGEITPSIQIKADYKTNSFSGSIIVKDIEYLAY